MLLLTSGNPNKCILPVLVILLFITIRVSAQTVRPFLPEVFSQFPNVRDLAISTDGSELYFTAQSPLGELSAIFRCRKKKSSWSQPEVAAFSGRYADLEPSFAPDGLRLYFVSARPVDADTARRDYNIWYIERKDRNSGWSAPIAIGLPVNTTGNEFYPSVSRPGGLCFTRDGAGSKGKDDIFYCRWENGAYTEPVSMTDSINSAGYEFNAFLAPDESFLLYTCYNKTGGLGSGDLYISTKNTEGQWTAAKNLGPGINAAQMDYCPFMDVASGTLYFTSKRTAVHSSFDQAQKTDILLKEMNRYDNGLSRIYEVTFNPSEKK